MTERKFDVREVRLDELDLDPNINIRFEVDEATVVRYMELFDQLPPVDVVDDKGTLILCDGFHRLEAGLRLGRENVFAEVRKGDRAYAVERAAVANAKHGLPLLQEEWERAAWRLSKLGFTQEQVAKKLGFSTRYTQTLIQAAKVREKVGAPTLTTAHMRQIWRAPEVAQVALARMAEEQHLSAGQLREVAEALRDGPTVVDDVLKDAIPGLTAMRDRLTYIRMFDDVVEKVRLLEQAGITPARLAGMLADPNMATRWTDRAEAVASYSTEVSKSLKTGRQLKVVP